MSRGARYLTGMAAAAGVGAAIAAVVPQRGPAVWLALAIALLVQGPLGWWVVRSVGTERLMPVWGIGLLLRFAVLGLAGFVLVPELGWPAEPTLLMLAGMLFALLLVEGATALTELSQGTLS